jgi:uncharacterized membrane protein YgdD (TMEM256/DUF423 family)
MKYKLIRLAALSGAVAVILGALGAHQLKTMLSASSLDSFDKGVKYQMYHTLLLLIMAFSYKPEIEKEIKQIAIFLILGISLFSFSIYLLSTQSITGIDFSFLGPITPLGGLAMITAWLLLAFNAKKLFNN